jgi:putative FmdB family regulatory protein
VPIYEYACQSCQHRFEVKQSMSDPPVTTCARCGQAVTKVISAPAIMFKGTGWYVTDYSDKMKPEAESKTEEKSEPAQKKEGESSTAATANQQAPAPAASEKPASQPASAGSSSSSTTPATPSSSPPK